MDRRSEGYGADTVRKKHLEPPQPQTQLLLGARRLATFLRAPALQTRGWRSSNKRISKRGASAALEGRMFPAWSISFQSVSDEYTLTAEAEEDAESSSCIAGEQTACCQSLCLFDNVRSASDDGGCRTGTSLDSPLQADMAREQP